MTQKQRAIDHSFDEQTSIITDIFINQLRTLNPNVDPALIVQELKNIQDELGFDDLGRSFYKRLLGVGEGSLRLIDWDNFSQNKFHITTELTCRNGEDEFRPDITVFINGCRSHLSK